MDCFPVIIILIIFPNFTFPTILSQRMCIINCSNNYEMCPHFSQAPSIETQNEEMGHQVNFTYILSCNLGTFTCSILICYKKVSEDVKKVSGEWVNVSNLGECWF